MAVSGKERQKKWQEKQKTKGKKRFTIMIDKIAAEILNSEKVKTGESMSAIVNRALLMIAGKTDSGDVIKTLSAEKRKTVPENAPGA